MNDCRHTGHHNPALAAEIIVTWRSFMQQEDPTAYPPSAGGTKGTASLRSADNQRLNPVPSSAVKPQRQAQSIGYGGSFVAACYGCSNCNCRVGPVQSSPKFSSIRPWTDEEPHGIRFRTRPFLRLSARAFQGTGAAAAMNLPQSVFHSTQQHRGCDKSVSRAIASLFRAKGSISMAANKTTFITQLW